ncbi:MAG: polymorphic toxin-type HINT domain-containing protein [Ruminococcus sp.]|nr:polymorphic toxin-type HINT domain-containing protein [Ruminococcus sp.]
MATITLRKDKINGVGGLIDSIVKSSNKLDTQLGTLRNTLQGVDSSTCNLQGVVSSISSSSKSEKEKVADLKRLNSKLTDFITMTARRDADAKSAVEKSKNDFYSKYSYLKPECEKNVFEHICDGIVTAAKWCKKHWKLIVTAIIVVVAVVLLCTGVGSGLGAVLLAGACWGAIMGACIGGVAGGLESMANGGSFLDGFEEGAFSGAISGAITGAACAGLGALGGAAGNFVKCGTALGKAIKGTAAVTKVLSIGMGGFDTLAMADRYFGSGNIAALNSKLHESTAYNVFQTGVTALAIFTGGMTTSMKCFVAGTMILTAEGLVAIENIKAGDKVLSQNPETGEMSYKNVAVSFVNQANKLAHVTVNGETIISTHDHPYYVKNRGFVNACDLWIGAELIDRKGVIHPVEQIYRENLGEDSVNVYNFKVEDFHTYYSGNTCVLVHNSDCGGRYGSLKDDKQGRQFENEEIHHMPADSASVLSKRDGVAIRMDKSDHRFTASYDRKRGSSEYRAMQKKLISEGRFQEAFDMDVADIQKNFPGKYDKSIQQAQKYLDSLFKAGKL